MPTAATFRLSLRIVTLASILACGTTLTGCAHLGSLYNGLWVRAQTHHELAGIRQDTRQELNLQLQEAQRLAADRQVEQARWDAERLRLESELCRANQEALHQQVRSNLKNVLESKVAFNVEHALEVGELEVDTEALQQVLKDREKAPLVAPFTAPKQPCGCCDQPCGCGSGILRRFCPHCRHKPCEAEQKCGGPEAFAQLQQQPLRQPLRPAEIPMKLPVRLSYGFQQPLMETARIRTQPLVTAPFQQVPCTEAVPCPTGFCPHPGQHGYLPPQQGVPAVAGLPPRDPNLAPVTPVEAPPPPVPAPDNEARRLPPTTAPAAAPPIRLGMMHPNLWPNR